MVIVRYIRHNAVHTAKCRMPYEICRKGARILSIRSSMASNWMETTRPLLFKGIRYPFIVKGVRHPVFIIIIIIIKELL